MLAGLCASALIPVALAEPGLLAAAAGLHVVGSVGANVLATLISDSLDAARIRTRRRSPADPAPGDAGDETGLDAPPGRKRMTMPTWRSSPSRCDRSSPTGSSRCWPPRIVRLRRWPSR